MTRSLTVVVLCLASSLASAQTKVGVVNFQRALLETAEIKKASAALEAKYKPRQAELEKLRKEIEDLQQKLQSLAGKLTPQAESEMTFQAQRKQREFQRLSEDLQSDVDEERNEILTKAGQRMREIINKLAEEKGLDVIIDVGNTLYFKPALDLTQEAIAAYDKAYPAR
ncbi:MAG: OmpH family outer membrane protein [Bryobacterales bacterium]|nr:OmpH family outer membrane protein [Bryobacteraceae bacterium]MDW8130777.1 OmpH family outer membrane protein [Bryobacterales bacterium]